MKWTASQPKPRPKVGDIRYVRRFLFLPTRIGDEVRWLGLEEIKQEAYRGACSMPEGPSRPCIKWRNVGWVPARRESF